MVNLILLEPHNSSTPFHRCEWAGEISGVVGPASVSKWRAAHGHVTVILAGKSHEYAESCQCLSTPQGGATAAGEPLARW